MTRVYISGQISGLPDDEARTKFQSAEDKLRAEGYSPINPMKLDHSGAVHWADYMATDLHVIMSGQVDCIYMLPCWRNSKGATIERYVAKIMGLKVIEHQNG